MNPDDNQRPKWHPRYGTPSERREPDYVYGRHAVFEALEAGRSIDRILLKRDLDSATARAITERAHAAGVPMQRVPIQRLDRITRKTHQGMIALLAAVDYYRLDDLIPSWFDEGGNPMVVVLDGVTDVRNFGAIARTCECAGVNAIVIPDHGSVSITADAVKTSAGALNVLPVCRVPRLTDAITLLRDSGFDIVGTSDHNATDYTTPDYTHPVAIVLGDEGNGISPQVMDLCNHRVVIPEFGQINSLNVSVAAGIVIYEAVRQRMAQGQTVK